MPRHTCVRKLYKRDEPDLLIGRKGEGKVVRSPKYQYFPPIISLRCILLSMFDSTVRLGCNPERKHGHGLTKEAPGEIERVVIYIFPVECVPFIWTDGD
jgi:hypothetical protein